MLIDFRRIRSQLIHKNGKRLFLLVGKAQMVYVNSLKKLIKFCFGSLCTQHSIMLRDNYNQEQ